MSPFLSQDKLKQLKDGTTARCIYYGCTRSKDLKCKGGYLREEDIINQLTKLIDQISIDQLTVTYHIQAEYERFRKFQSMLGREKCDTVNLPTIDPKSYAKYLLKSGSSIEKRELLGSLKSKLLLKDKVLVLEK